MIGRFNQTLLFSSCVFTALFLPVVATFAKDKAKARPSWCDTEKGPSASSPRTTVDLGWSGSQSIDISIPAQVEYRTGSKAEATVSGNADLVSHVRLFDGKIVWDREEYHYCIVPADLLVHIVGPSVATWRVHGIGQLNLNNISQDSLEITKHGTGSVTANGDVKEILLRANGAGRVDLSRLETQRASVHIHGSGEVDLTPREDADIAISGSAVLRIHGNRAKLHVRSYGSAQVIQVPSDPF